VKQIVDEGFIMVGVKSWQFDQIKHTKTQLIKALL
jgi:hypothetical protein